MAISPLSVQQIVAVIRQQMVDTVRPRAADTTALAPELVKKGEGKRTRTARAKQSDLSKMIGHRVGALDEFDPERGRKAFRIFLESILINELGEDLINDPSFYQMVDEIHSQMENMPEIANAMQDATAQLLTGGAPGSNSQR